MARPLRVLAFANTLAMLDPKMTSGGDMRFFQIFKRLCGRGEVALGIMTSAAGKARCETEPLPGAHYFVLPRSRGEDCGDVAMLSTRIFEARAIAQEAARGADVLYTTSDYLPDVVAASRARRAGGVWIAMVFHLIPPPHRRQGNMMRNIMAFVAQRLSIRYLHGADAVFVDNAGIRESLLELGFSPSQVIVVPLGVDPAEFSAAPSREEYDACFVARFHPTKGIADIPKIWSTVIHMHPGARLAVVGAHTPKQLATFQAALEHYGVAHAVFVLGRLPRHDLLKVLASSRLFITPSREEGWGISVAEAMAAGKPVVAYDLPVFREVFPKGMYRVPIGDVSAFGLAIAALLNDPVRRERLSDEAIAHAATLDWEGAAISEVRLLREICSRVHPSQGRSIEVA